MRNFMYCRHAIPGRIRLQIMLPNHNICWLQAIQVQITGISGISSCSCNEATGRFLIFYDTNQWEYKFLLRQINHKISFIIEKSYVSSVSLQQHTLSEAAAHLQTPDPNNLVTRPWYKLSAQETIELLCTDPEKGLTVTESGHRLEIFGPNHFYESPRPSLWSLFMGQFNLMTRLLLGAGGVSLMLGQIADAVSILVIVLLEALVGMFQENRAEQSLGSLKLLTSPEAIVMREGRQIRIPAANLVPGDIIMLEAGNLVPADCRLINCNNLEVKEDTLTGESQTVGKQYEAHSHQNLDLAEQDNMVFMGTYVTRGRAQAVVVETGTNTEMGHIATLLGGMKIEMTPLQKQLNKLGRDLSYVCLVVCAGITLFGLLRGKALLEMLRTGISLAVGSIPEGLPAIVTISMAFGVQRMAGKNTVVRRLPMVETLAYATVICSDKTGTLTSNEMTVSEVYMGERSIKITGHGYIPQGQFMEGGLPIQVDQEDSLLALMFIGALCNNAHLHYENQTGHWQVVGDPTEAALLVLARKAGIDPIKLRQMMVREMEVPFESDTRLMAVVLRNEDGERILFVKGAPDQVLEHCSFEYHQTEESVLTLKRRNQILTAGEEMASRALRVIGAAYKVLTDNEIEPLLLFTDLTFVGLTGMMDPPRPEVRGAIEKCKQAGIKVTMITGDQRQTAVAIARELDMLSHGRQISGNEIDAMSDEELAASIRDIELVYRASPLQKLRMVRAYKKQGLVVVMTGDGVNDAPAVREAHVGISMGRGGTDVTREASGITLTDDSFATIVTAVEEGRAIRSNIRKFIRYVLAGNLGEIIAVSGCSMLGLPIPLEPGHILLVNLVTEGIPALALGMDPPDPGCMQMSPENPDRKILDTDLGRYIVNRGSAIGATTMGMFAYGLMTGPGNMVRAKTMALSNLVSCQMFNVFDSRYINQGSDHKSIPPKNAYLFPSVMISLGLVLGIIYLPWLRGIFSTYPLGFRDWITVLLSSGIVSRLGNLTGVERQQTMIPAADYVTPIDKYRPQASTNWNLEDDLLTAADHRHSG